MELHDLLRQEGDDYERKVLNFVKDNPDITEGMLVAVYDGVDHINFGGYARVLETEWSAFYYQYLATIRTTDGREYSGCFTSHMRRIRLASNQTYSFMRVIDGDRP